VGKIWGYFLCAAMPCHSVGVDIVLLSVIMRSRILEFIGLVL